MQGNHPRSEEVWDRIDELFNEVSLRRAGLKVKSKEGMGVEKGIR